MKPKLNTYHKTKANTLKAGLDSDKFNFHTTVMIQWFLNKLHILILLPMIIRITIMHKTSKQHKYSNITIITTHLLNLLLTLSSTNNLNSSSKFSRLKFM